MELAIYQVDAFADDVFRGNPAAVVPLKKWLPDATLQAIALENNLSETAFVVPHDDGAEGHYHLRWFTPGAEVDLCGHATLGSAFVLFEFLGEASELLKFETLSGTLTVEKGEGGWLSMDFPARVVSQPLQDESMIQAFESALGAKIAEARQWKTYALLVLESEHDVRNVHDINAIAAALHPTGFLEILITAPASQDSGFDFVSRFFAPAFGIPEDPVTGSAHCMLAPYWAERLGRTEFVAYQASPRGGTVNCRVVGDRVRLAGRAAPYLKGTITI